MLEAKKEIQFWKQTNPVVKADHRKKNLWKPEMIQKMNQKIQVQSYLNENQQQ